MTDAERSRSKIMSPVTCWVSRFRSSSTPMPKGIELIFTGFYCISAVFKNTVAQFGWATPCDTSLRYHHVIWQRITSIYVPIASQLCFILCYDVSRWFQFILSCYAFCLCTSPTLCNWWLPFAFLSRSRSASEKSDTARCEETHTYRCLQRC